MSKIKFIRKKLGLTQSALAEGIGVTQGNICHYEKRGQTVPPSVAARLVNFAAAKGLHLTFDDIYAPKKEKA